MRILLDTRCWLWLHTAPERFSSSMLARLGDPATTRLLSVASAWEIAIKHALGKLALPDAPEAWLPARMRSSMTTPLPVELAHALEVARLPRHHADPFDRVIVAQARVEELVLVTADDKLRAYEVDLRSPQDDV